MGADKKKRASAPKTDAVLTLRALNRATLARQMLLARERIGVVAAVERLAGMQAQVAKPPFIGLWTRVEGFERGALARTLADRKVVRATLMRGTLHLASARDYLTLRGALQPGLTAGMRSILRQRADELDVPALLRAATAFFDDEPRTFDELRDELLRRNPKIDERAAAYAVRTHLPLVQVATDDPWSFPASADFATARKWLGKSPAVDADPAPLIRRYLAAFGPASVADAQAWSGLAGLREAFERLRDELVVFRDERKRELFDLSDAPRPDEDTPAPPRFLPEFDNLVLAHDDRARVLDAAHRSLVVTKNLRVLATFLVDGRVAGTWEVERKKMAATLVLAPFSKLAKSEREALSLEGERLLEFTDPDATSRAIRFA
ncbi:MAG: winged helix DNA-binding domain-containing protein [Planctomycetes bacterium]|nr:winged helix DNA-binding domain-containing protein [Planctomycetota bacterium]